MKIYTIEKIGTLSLAMQIIEEELEYSPLFDIIPTFMENQSKTNLKLRK